MAFNLMAETGEDIMKVMPLGFPLFWQYGIFTVLMILSTIILANIIRRKVPFMRRSMMPTAVIGGLILMFVRFILEICGADVSQAFEGRMLFLITFHMLPVGFISLGLRDKKTVEGDEHNEIDESKKQVNPVKTGAMIVGGYMIQAIVGIGLTVLFAFVLFKDVFAGAEGSGILLALGFGQGPGQAMINGTLFQENGMSGGLQFGLAIAAIGFVWASIGGIFVINRVAKKRGIDIKKKGLDKTSGLVTSGTIEEPDEIPLSEGVDKFTIQICIIGLIYLLTMGFCLALDKFLTWDKLGLGKMGQSLANVFWGFNFIFGIVFAMIFKLIVKKLRKYPKWGMSRRYVNNYMLNRIGGFAFDLMIIASLASLSVVAIGAMWWPILIITTAGGFITLAYTRLVCYRVFKGYGDEAFVCMFGMLTGTVTNGIILLREIDPNFKTPAAMDQVLGAVTGMIFGIPMLILIPIALNVPGAYIVLGICVVYFAFLLWVQMGRFGWLAKMFKGKKKAVADEPAAQSETHKNI